MRKAVVVLTRLPLHKICVPRPSISQKCCNEDEPLSSPDSDTPWEPDDYSCDSDSSIPSSESGPNKRRKMDEKNNILAKSGAASHKISEAKSNTVKTSAAQANSNTDAKSSTAKTSSTLTSADAKTLLAEVNRNGNTGSNEGKTSAPKSTNGNGHKHTTTTHNHACACLFFWCKL